MSDTLNDSEFCNCEQGAYQEDGEEYTDGDGNRYVTVYLYCNGCGEFWGSYPIRIG